MEAVRPTERDLYSRRHHLCRRLAVKREDRQGIRIGSVKDGKVTAFIAQADPKQEMPEGVAADKDGNVFGGFTTDMDLRKFARN